MVMKANRESPDQGAHAKSGILFSHIPSDPFLMAWLLLLVVAMCTFLSMIM